MSHDNSLHFQECIQACYDCLTACELCANSCLYEPQVDAMTRCIAMDRSCADICELTARELVRTSPFANELCALCATVCEACAEECARHDVEHCENCALACRDCAAACRQIAGAIPATI